MKNLLLFLALVAGGTVAHGQRIHGYAKAKVNGQEAFQLNDSTEVYAVPTDKGYRVQKRVWVPNASISNGVIMPGSALYNDKGVQIGQTLGADVPLVGAQPATERKLRKYQVGLIEGEVRSTHLQSGSWPEGPGGAAECQAKRPVLGRRQTVFQNLWVHRNRRRRPA